MLSPLSDMLRSLDIKDFAIIDELSVDFGPGLNVMTGETGAGKTIIVEALNLVLGARASQDLIRAGKDRASVTACFDATKLTAFIRGELQNVGIDCDDEIIIHRVVGGAKGKMSINGIPVTANVLKNVAERLVDVSSQHEHQLLLEKSHHFEVLDEFGEHGGLLAAYLEQHSKFVSLKNEIDDLERNEVAAKEELEYLKFQFDEIKSANLKPGEDKEIESERSRLKHSVLLEERARGAEAILYGNAGSTIEMLGEAIRIMDECSRYDEPCEKWVEQLERARSEIEDAARSLAKYADGLESDPASLEDLEERFHLIRRIVKKHGGSIEACLNRQEKIEEEVRAIDSYDDVIAEKKAKLAEIAAKRKAAAGSLSKARAISSKKMEKAVEAELAELEMARTKFSVSTDQRSEGDWDESGPDEIEFLIAPNVGEPLMPLAKIASGGELSRIMLALKCVLASNESVASTSVFDEVDSGIGGAVAEVVGGKLKQVSKSRQILCITHLPQVAVWGVSHLKISKALHDGRTVTSLKRLPDEERVSEIARMLGGKNITNTTMDHAREMLDTAIANK